MIEKIIFLSTCLVSVLSDKCFTQNDINGSDKLFTYKGDVYNMTGYNHPGGKNSLTKLAGNDLSEFVNSNSDSFHLSSQNFYNDLDNMYVGQLEKTCSDNTTTTTTDSPSPSPSTSKSTSTSTSTSESTSTSTSTSIKTISAITDMPTTIYIPKIVNSSDKITSYVLFATFLLIFNTIYNI